MKRCVDCNKFKRSYWFGKISSGWATRDGRYYCCRICNFKKTVRYTKSEKKPGDMFIKLIPHDLSIFERVVRFIK